MGERTSIAWCHSTFNPVLGCTKLDSPSPAGSACASCYAATFSRRTGRKDRAGRELWDPHAERHITSPEYWLAPLAWNERAAASGEPHRVFCGSMCDWADLKIPRQVHANLWDLIRATPALTWLLLSKRVQNIPKLLPSDWGDGWPNVWMGCTTENQLESDRRLAILTRIPAAVRFISGEPLLEEINVSPWLGDGGIGWAICGGESAGNKARPMRPAWARSLRDQCQAAGVPFFFKQTGSARSEWPGVTGKGETLSEFPRDLQIRELPARVPTGRWENAGFSAV
jgi:protein gp37